MARNDKAPEHFPGMEGFFNGMFGIVKLFFIMLMVMTGVGLFAAIMSIVGLVMTWM